MKLAAIGRTQLLYDSIIALAQAGHTFGAIVTAPASPEYSRNERDFVELGDRLGIPVYVTTRLDHPEIIEALGGLELAVSVNWISVLKKKHIDLFTHGILNAHAGDLPAYRGNACPNWAILDGAPEVVLSVHKILPDELDCGSILHQEHVTLDQSTRIADIYTWLENVTPRAFVQAVERLAADPEYRLKAVSSSDPRGFRCYPRVPDDGFVDWTRSADEIHALIRASGRPFAGAYCYVHQEDQIRKLVILESRVVNFNERDRAVPGQVLQNDRVTGESVIRCGTGALAILLCKYEGEGPEFRPGEKWRTIRMRLGVRPDDWLWMIYKRQQVKTLELSELAPMVER
jgi:methionyl-tRNA formyltransferase